MASFPPSQQNASQHQGNNGNNLAYAAAPALSTNPPPSQSIDPYRSSLSNEAVGSHPNNNIFIPLNPWNSPFVYVPNKSNTSYTQQTTVQQSYPTGYSYRQSAPVQQANLPNYHPQFQPFHSFVLANRPQASLRTTAAPQQPEQQIIQARRLVPRIVLPPDRMSNGNNPTMPGDQWFSLARSEQQPTSFAMERQPARPARNIDHYSSEEVSPRSKPNRAPRVEDYPDLMKDAQAHLARLGQSVPQIQGINPPTTRSSSNSSIPLLSLAGPEDLVAAVANASTAETTQQFVDLTRRQSSNATSQQQQGPETFAQLWDSLDPSEFHAHNPPVISGDQKELPVDFPDYLKTNHRAAQTVAGVLSQSSKTLDIPLRSKAVRDALNRALAAPSMVVVSEVLTSVGAINAAPANQHSSAPPTGVCPRSFFGTDGPLTSLVAPGRSATVRPVRSANAYPCEGGYTPHDSLPSPPGPGVSQRVPTPGLPSPPERSAASRPSLQPASTTAAMSPPHPPAAVNPGNSPQQARPAYIQRYPDILGPGMRPNVAPWEAPLDQSYPEGSYSVRTGSSQSYTTAFTTAKDPVALMKIAHDTRVKREGKRKREEELGSVTPPESPRMVGEVGFPSVVAASYGNQGESSKRSRTDSGLEPFPSLMGTHQANESRPRGHLFPGYAGHRHPIPPTTAYTNIQQTQGSRPPLHRTHESSPPYMINQQAQETIPPYMINQQPQESSPPYMNNQETQTAAPAHMINQQTQAACPDPQPTRVDAEMLAAIGPYASLF